MSYKIDIAPVEVEKVLKKHILKDGYDVVMDLKRSEGIWLYDSKHNRRLLDFFTCFATIPVGYNHPAMIQDEVFKENLLEAALINPSNSDIYTTQFAHFLDTFSRVGIPDYLSKAFFIAGGSLAVENALKVAMDWKVQKNFEKGYTREVGTKVLHFKEAFHGRSGYTISLTNTDPNKIRYFAKFEDWPRVLNPKIRFPYTDENHDDLVKREQLSLRQIERAFEEHKDEICAIIIEPIQGEGGDNHFRREFMIALRQLCDENDCLLIFDEVQMGVAVTGKFWAHEHFGPQAQPDLIAFGKKMQVCGILGGAKIDQVPNNCFTVSSRINSTWGANLTDFVRAAKILEIIESDQLIAQAERVGNYFIQRLLELQTRHPHISNIRGRGLIVAFDFPTTELRNEFLKVGMTKGAMFLGCATHSIRFRPALVITEQDIDLGISIIHDTLVSIGL
jgi:L-lysine 6-transaminase